MKLKICGIKSLKNLQICLVNQVDYVGFNFCKQSKRYINLGDVLKNIDILPKNNIKYVAIIKDNSNAELEEILSIKNIDILQVYDMNLLKNIQNLRKKYKIWYCISKDNLSELEDTLKLSDLILFDSQSPGSGLQFSNEIQLNFDKINYDFAIAGGINASNIVDFKIKYKNAKLLDLASGVQENGNFSEGKLIEICNLFYKNGE